MKRDDGLARQVWAYCERFHMLPQGGTVLCAVSGGRDSMALLHILSRLAGEAGFQVAAAHFHHGLRAAADRDEAFVRAWCRGKGIPLTCGKGDTRAFAGREGLSIEDAARTLRYAFLEAAAQDMGAERIAAAHHREDNAETVLLHLLRGAGPQGLGGIPPVRGKIVRPLLETGRDEIDAYIARNAIPYVEDESNQDAVYTRNRVRLEVMPLLEEIAPGCAARIASAAKLLREENSHLQRETDRLLPAGGKDSILLPAAVLDSQDQAIRRRLVRGMAHRLGVSLSLRQTEDVLALGSGGFLDLPGNLCALRSRERLVLQKQPPPLPPMELREGEQAWGPWRVLVARGRTPMAETPYRAVLRDTGGGLSIAPWDGGGRLAVENGRRTIKRLYLDAGLSLADRGRHPAVLVDGKIAAVFGVAADWGFRPEDGGPLVTVTLLPDGGGTE